MQQIYLIGVVKLGINRQFSRNRAVIKRPKLRFCVQVFLHQEYVKETFFLQDLAGQLFNENLSIFCEITLFPQLEMILSPYQIKLLEASNANKLQ